MLSETNSVVIKISCTVRPSLHDGKPRIGDFFPLFSLPRHRKASKTLPRPRHCAEGRTKMYVHDEACTNPARAGRTARPQQQKRRMLQNNCGPSRHNPRRGSARYTRVKSCIHKLKQGRPVGCANHHMREDGAGMEGTVTGPTGTARGSDLSLPPYQRDDM